MANQTTNYTIIRLIIIRLYHFNKYMDNVHKKLELMVLLITLSMASLAIGQSMHDKKVLILNSYHAGLKWTDDQVSAAKAVLLKTYPDIEVYTEYMDTKRYYSVEYLEQLRDIFWLKYQHIKFDAIITTDDNALYFVMKYHESFFAEAPVSFCGINNYNKTMLEGREQVTGLVEVLDIQPTLDLALKLHPGTRHIVVVVDNTPTGIGQRKDVVAVARGYENLEFQYLKGDDFSNEELFERLRSLPSDSIVLLMVWLRDKDNTYLSPNEAGPLISSNSTVPVYGIIDMYLGHGIVGGKLLNSETHGKTAAEMAVRILGGEKPSDIPILFKSNNPYMFDYRQLNRWQIRLSDLPEGAVVINKPFSIYNEYKKLIWGAISLISLLLVTVVILLINISRRKRAEDALRENEEKLRTLVSSSSDAIISLDTQRRLTMCNPAFLNQFGYTDDEVIGKSIGFIHPSEEVFNRFGDEVYPLVHETGTWRGEWTYVGSQGGTFNMETALSAQKLFDGSVTGYTAVMRDLTERTRAEEALRKSEELHRTILKTALEGFWIVDLEGRLLQVNETYCLMSGYAEEELLDISITDLEASEVPADTAEHLQKVIARGEDRFESRHRRKDGTVFDVEVSVQYQPLEGGRVVAFLRDITERKLAEEALRSSESKWRATLEATPFPTAVVDLQDDKLSFWSRSARRLFGHTAPTALEWYQIAYPDPDYRREVIERWKSFLEIARESGQPVNTGEYRITCRDGSVRICELYATFLPDNLIVTFNDITERKRAEEALRESGAKYRALVENSNDAIFIVQDGAIQFWNPKTEDLSGYPAGELARLPFATVIHPDDREMVVENHRRRLRGEKLPTTYSFRIIRKDGQVRWVQLNTALFTWANGLATLNILRDTSEQKELEDLLRQSQKMEALGTLAGGIAHDFNNVLAAMMGYTELALEDIAEEAPGKEHLQQVLKSGVRAKNLVQQILSFSRRTDPEKKPLQLAPIIKETMNLLRATTPTTIEIIQEVEAGTHTVLADPTQIHQLVMNLCSNAAHAMRERGGILKISLKRVDLEETSTALHAEFTPGVYNRLTVSDTGEGMDKETVERIFDPFFTTKDAGQGTGMGLAVAHGVVKAHGGTITVNSEAGKGSTFHVYLPLMETEAEKEASVDTHPLPTGKEHILFVDDEELLVGIGQQMLERLGYQVTVRTSSIEALEVFKAKPDRFGLIITDQTMPTMSGLDLAKAIHSIRPDIPVILCTGYSSLLSGQTAEAIGVKRVLMKPLGVRDLAAAVRGVLDGE